MKPRTLWQFTYYPTEGTATVSDGHKTWGAAIDAAKATGYTYDEPEEYPAPPPVTPRATLRRFRDAGLNLSQSEALCLVAEHPDGVQLKSLAADLGVSPATMSVIAATLHRKSLVTRRHGLDRRAEWLDITEAGYSLTTETPK